MVSTNFRAALYLTSALGLCASTPVFAQAAGEQSGGVQTAGSGPAAASSAAVADARTGEGASDAGDIIVTARRTEERLQDVPISISVFSQQQLTNRNIVTAGDLGTYTPSLGVNQRFGENATSFAIRGFTQESQTSPSVAVYFADVTAPRAQGGLTAGNGAGVGSFFDLQNVQVLKGPQGTLFGRNTTGGAVLLVPQKPTSNLEGYVEGSYGNYDMKRVQGVINLPVSDTIRFRFGADYQNRDGYIKNHSGIGPKDFSDVNYISLRASLVIDLTPTLENYTIGTYSRSNTSGFYPRVALCNTKPTGFVPSITAPMGCAQLARGAARGDGFYDVENGEPDAHEYIRQFQFINTTTWNASDALTIKNIASYSEYKQNQAANIFGENFTIAGGRPFTFVGLRPQPGRDNVGQYTFTEELQAQFRSADGRFNAQGGVYFEKSGPRGGFQGTYASILISCTNLSQLQCADTFGNAFGFSLGSVTDTLTKYYFRDLGLYAQATYELSDKLSVTGGIRYTSDRVSSTGELRKVTYAVPNVPVERCALAPFQLAPTADVCRVTEKESSKRPTWLIDLDYKPTDKVLIYGKYARGYRQGGVNTSGAAFRSWNPEKVDSYEVGAKTSFGGALRGTFNIAAFYNDFSDQQLQSNIVPVLSASPISAILNAGKSRIEGIEVDSSIRPFTGFTLDVGYAYLKTKLKSFDPPAYDATVYNLPTPTAIVGGTLTLSPKNRVTVTGTYTLPLAESIGRVSFAATYTHTDKQLLATGSPFSEEEPTDLLNLNLNWNKVAGTPVDLSLFATNVTQKKYHVYVGGNYASTGYEGIVLGQPRMYGLRLRYTFGR